MTKPPGRLSRYVRSHWFSRQVLARTPSLLFGIALIGFGVGLMALSGLGLGSWSVLHQGISRQAAIALGTADILVSVPVLLAWIPLRLLPGLGTIGAAFLVGPMTNLTLDVVAVPESQVVRIGFLAVGSILIAIGSSMYLAANLGTGPRDGIMTGLHARFGWSIRSVRTVLELSVLVIGFLLGGTLGIGTVVHTFAVGPMIQLSLRWLDPDGLVMRHRQGR